MYFFSILSLNSTDSLKPISDKEVADKLLIIFWIKLPIENIQVIAQRLRFRSYPLTDVHGVRLHQMSTKYQVPMELRKTEGSLKYENNYLKVLFLFSLHV